MMQVSFRTKAKNSPQLMRRAGGQMYPRHQTGWLGQLTPTFGGTGASPVLSSSCRDVQTFTKPLFSMF
jgi:hypothetical protein